MVFCAITKVPVHFGPPLSSSCITPPSHIRVLYRFLVRSPVSDGCKTSVVITTPLSCETIQYSFCVKEKSEDVFVPVLFAVSQQLPDESFAIQHWQVEPVGSIEAEHLSVCVSL